MSTNTSDAAERAAHPLITVMHASVGSGHKAAAAAIADAVRRMSGSHGVPADVDVEIIDILDFGRIPLDGNKTAASFTGATRPIYDITWRYTLTGRLLWGGGTGWSKVMFPSFSDYVRQRRPRFVAGACRIAPPATACSTATSASS